MYPYPYTEATYPKSLISGYLWILLCLLSCSTAESDSGSLNQYTVTSSGEPVELYLSGQQLQNGNLITLCIKKESLSNDDGDGNKNGKKK